MPKSTLVKKITKPDVLTPPDESAQAIFDTGNEVGDLACAVSDSEEVLLGCELFPAGKEVPFTRNYDEMIATTLQWLDDGLEYIYEATFNYDGILVMVDVFTCG